MSNYTGKEGGLSRAGGQRLFGGVQVPASSGMEVEFPNRDTLKDRKILVCTLVTSGRYGIVSSN